MRVQSAAGARKAAVFLDRDGTLNRAILRDGKSYPPPTVETFELLPGAAAALRDLRASGFLLVVVTNQPDVGAGRQRREVVEAQHAYLRELAPVDDIRVCYHVDADGCACRKPKPGMILDAAAHWGIDVARSYMIGDRWRDVTAGRAAGCRTIFIRNAYDEPQPTDHDLVVESVAEASQAILSRRV